MTRRAPRKLLSISDGDEDQCWAAVVARDRAFDDVFYCCVKTTGIYCRPSCASRRPLRANVTFCETRAQAEQAGFRACKRCKPDQLSISAQNVELVAQACRLIEVSDAPLKLAELAEAAGISPYHFHRLFKSITGVTPKAFGQAHLRGRVRELLGTSDTVTEAIYDAGFNSSGPFYADATGALGMTPTQFRSGGRDATIRFAIGACSLGAILVAMSGKGVCAISLGDDPNELVRDLQDRFVNADLIGGDRDFERLAAKVIGFVEDPASGLDLPLDVRGTAFQQRVWQALQKIPAGQTASYAEVARRIGDPKAVRAVAGACGANAIAVAIPCHRVVRTGGAVSGYRWGVERKAALLKREAGED